MTEEKPHIPRTPNKLGTRGRKAWIEFHAIFDFSQDPHRHMLVEDICREFDLIDRLQRALDAGDLRVKGSQGQPVSAPEVAEIRLHRQNVAQLIARLGLPADEESDAQRAVETSDIARYTGVRPSGFVRGD